MKKILLFLSVLFSGFLYAEKYDVDISNLNIKEKCETHGLIYKQRLMSSAEYDVSTRINWCEDKLSNKEGWYLKYIDGEIKKLSIFEHNHEVSILFGRNEKAKNISIMSLISNSKDYNEYSIRIQGFLSFDFERTAIYLHKEDYEYNMYKNAIWLWPNSFIYKNIGKSKDLSYVTIEGVFSDINRGPGGLFSGSISKINFIEKLDKD